MTVETIEINITGIVQGVGFRPFLFNLAREHDLNGYILNRGNAGVRLILQGKRKKIETFLEQIDRKKPPISYIENISTNIIDTNKGFDNLEIKSSEQGRGISLTLPPDVAICDNCLKEMRNPRLKRYYQYPFIACAVCGPRFTTVKELPYDRIRSTMMEFPFCEGCYEEYTDFDNRRFHAQTYACSVCGPNYSLYTGDRKKTEKKDISGILKDAADRINKGEVAAVKGIGGVHLVCLADEDEVLLNLRERKGERKYKPFALMIPNIKVIEDTFKISETERSEISSFRRPITLLEKKGINTGKIISEWVAPGLNNVGFMLPYAGIHYLLFDYVGYKPLVYTSGNKSHIPMGIENEKIFNQLENLADFFLLHDRTIYQRADDSVLRVHEDKVKIIRRSRGYVPEYLPLPFGVNVPGALATGPELANTGAVLRRNRIFPTQHIGNVTHLETFEFLKDALFHMKSLLQIKDKEIQFIACDAHPGFITTQYAMDLSTQLDISLFKVQHHFAHILGLMAENKVQKEELIIGISTDGVGYGDDGNVWGGEILLCSYEGYERLGHLEYQPMIGGDRCTKYPARMAASIILHHYAIEEAEEIFRKLKIEKDLEYGNTELQAMIAQYKKSKGRLPSETIPLSSSTGRIFDVVSYLLEVCNYKSYRGEPAMRLEGFAAKGNASKVPLKCECTQKKGLELINTSKLVENIITLLFEGKYPKEDIAARFQEAFAEIYGRVATMEAEKHGIKKIGLSGGVAYNYTFSNKLKKYIEKRGFTFLEHLRVAPGDAGISTGQLIGALFQFQQN